MRALPLYDYNMLGGSGVKDPNSWFIRDSLSQLCAALMVNKILTEIIVRRVANRRRAHLVRCKTNDHPWSL